MDYPLVIKFLSAVKFKDSHSKHIFTLMAVVGVPYRVQVFAENGAGNGSFCTITDFGDEACKS